VRRVGKTDTGWPKRVALAGDDIREGNWQDQEETRRACCRVGNELCFTFVVSVQHSSADSRLRDRFSDASQFLSRSISSPLSCFMLRLPFFSGHFSFRIRSFSFILVRIADSAESPGIPSVKIGKRRISSSI
jgi:hypothetical protein